MKLRNSFKHLIDMNIQDYVSVKLTDKGYKIYDAFHQKFNGLHAPLFSAYRFTLKELMQIFGPHLFEPNTLQIFENNEVKIV